MSILCDEYIEELVLKGLVTPADYNLINPASLDIRVGTNAIKEGSYGNKMNLGPFTIGSEGIKLEPGEFVLVDTFETFNVPNGYAADIRLKSSTARTGFDHSSAFWLDPGYRGKPTMEIKNVLRYNSLQLVPGERFAQVILHKLVGMARRPYSGRYHGASEVEAAKD